MENLIRLLGVTGSDLVEKNQAVKQLDLFSYEKDAKKEPLIKTLNQLRQKYGDSIIERAGEKMTKMKHTDRLLQKQASAKIFLTFFQKNKSCK